MTKEASKTPGLDLLEALLDHQSTSNFLAPTQKQDHCMAALLFVLREVGMQARYCMGSQTLSKRLGNGMLQELTRCYPMLVVDGVMHNCNGYVGREEIEEHLAMQMEGSPDLSVVGVLEWHDVACTLADYALSNHDGPTFEESGAAVAEGIAFAQEFLLHHHADPAPFISARPRL